MLWKRWGLRMKKKSKSRGLALIGGALGTFLVFMGIFITVSTEVTTLSGVMLFLVIGFGFWLERAGFGYSRKLALQFYFKDMTVLKVMFTAIITGMIGLLFLSLFGWIDLNLVYINPTFLWPQILGGIILGFGFIIGGY